MDLAKQLQELEQIHGDGSKGKILTMYLNTDPADPDQQGGKWRITLKNGLRNFEKYIQESNDEQEMKEFQRVKEKVTNYINNNELDLKKGLIIFATADDRVWFTAKVQVRLRSDFYWQETPVLDQLIELKQDYPRAGIILVQSGQVKIIESNMNEVEGTVHYELDLDTEDWKQKLGPQQAKGDMQPGAHNLQVDNFNSRADANRYRWFKSIAPKLDMHAKSGNWEKIFVMGEPDAAQTVTDLMNKPVDGVLQKNMLDQDEHRVLDELFG
ncbi:VLRF1 family aeRF1-type release factor [Aciduricibacillus chroicocephali]|uniref:VLRF1 family aeRF1-type release factor n=1 Tax=Aciduricibacillus chroicocephali TaxID=3054939 RepID=A0ABY9KSY8_9BACI|nr:VLRF1 family aeRF1-type release factor [Bacillaceae bacterium 44XB]